jgi:polyhydroxybutyrate depolymerase
MSRNLFLAGRSMAALGTLAALVFLGTTPAPAQGNSPPGTTRYSLVTDGGTRTYNLHIPVGFSTAKTYPLVLVFHGAFGTGAIAEKQTNFDAKAGAEGFIVVYPDGIGKNWNDGRGTVNPDIDDVGFVRQLITLLKSLLPIDAKRIYAAGISNGGMFTERLGCELADVLAAIGPDVGPMPTNELAHCKPARPIAVLGIQGGADPLIPIGGGKMPYGKGGDVESATATMSFWASVNGCNPTPTLVQEPPAVNDGTRVDKYTFAGCTAGTPVGYIVVQGMGHGWPPETVALYPSITGPTSHNIKATDVMWDFFSTISR